MVFQITASVDDPRTLTQVVLQVTTMLDMLQAELARVLQVNCGDIGLLSSGRRVIEAGTYHGRRPGCLCVSTRVSTLE
jgi:hypothetical protein